MEEEVVLWVKFPGESWAQLRVRLGACALLLSAVDSTSSTLQSTRRTPLQFFGRLVVQRSSKKNWYPFVVEKRLASGQTTPVISFAAEEPSVRYQFLLSLFVVLQRSSMALLRKYASTKDEKIIEDVKEKFKGEERVSGTICRDSSQILATTCLSLAEDMLQEFVVWGDESDDEEGEKKKKEVVVKESTTNRDEKIKEKEKSSVKNVEKLAIAQMIESVVKKETNKEDNVSKTVPGRVMRPRGRRPPTSLTTTKPSLNKDILGLSDFDDEDDDDSEEEDKMPIVSITRPKNSQLPSYGSSMYSKRQPAGEGVPAISIPIRKHQRSATDSSSWAGTPHFIGETPVNTPVSGVPPANGLSEESLEQAALNRKHRTWSMQSDTSSPNELPSPVRKESGIEAHVDGGVVQYDFRSVLKKKK